MFSFTVGKIDESYCGVFSVEGSPLVSAPKPKDTLWFGTRFACIFLVGHIESPVNFFPYCFNIFLPSFYDLERQFCLNVETPS